MTDSFYLGAYWGGRAESLKEIVNKTLQTLQRIGDIDEQFDNWYEGGMTRKEAVDGRVVLNEKSIERLCLLKVKKRELDKDGFAKMGFLFSLWTGHKDEESSSITFNVGVENNLLTNSCVIKMPFIGLAKERLLSLEKAKALLSMLVELWNPDNAVLSSYYLNEQIKAINKVGWITFSRTIKQEKDQLNGIVAEKCGDGFLFYINSTDKSYNYDRMNELSLVKEIL
jgi:hypothetical protein